MQFQCSQYLLTFKLLTFDYWVLQLETLDWGKLNYSMYSDIKINIYFETFV